MAIGFPNSSRSYDSANHCVRFWGHDAAFEITFEVEARALPQMASDVAASESAVLAAFDANRERIEQVASRIYGKRRQNFFRLSASDF